jgi:long-chain acyl-CoA synthetase
MLQCCLEGNSISLSQKKAVICAERTCSYFELNQWSNQLANALIKQGLQRQDRVAICLENSIETVIAIYAVLKASGIFVLIHPDSKAEKIQRILVNSDAKILITEAAGIAATINFLTASHTINPMIWVQREGDDANDPEQGLSFWPLLAQGGCHQPPQSGNERDIASLIYTSGSTGQPKGVTLTHANMLFALNAITTYLDNTADDVILNCLPLAFDYGLYQVLMSIKMGGTIVLERKFVYPYQFIGLVNAIGITGLPVVPAMIAILLQYKNLEKYSLPTLRYITSTAQSLPPSHLLRLQALFPNVRIFSMYGLTECKRVSFLLPDQIQARHSSVGKALPNTETYLIDESGAPISTPETVGQLLVRGPHVMQGYWNCPEETETVLQKFPWCPEPLLLTGDLFYVDAEGFLFFFGRKDDLLKVSGEKVWPKEIESVLYQLEDVLEAIVYGMPDPILGQQIQATVVLRQGSLLTALDLRLHCSQHLESFKIPQQVEIRATLPKTETGKLQRSASQTIP